MKNHLSISNNFDIRDFASSCNYCNKAFIGKIEKSLVRPFNLGAKAASNLNLMTIRNNYIFLFSENDALLNALQESFRYWSLCLNKSLLHTYIELGRVEFCNFLIEVLGDSVDSERVGLHSDGRFLS